MGKKRRDGLPRNEVTANEFNMNKATESQKLLCIAANDNTNDGNYNATDDEKGE